MLPLHDKPIGTKLRQVVVDSFSIAPPISCLAIIGSEVWDRTTKVREDAAALAIPRTKT